MNRLDITIVYPEGFESLYRDGVAVRINDPDKGSSYTEAQWEEANKKFSALLDKAKDAKDLSEDELREIARLQGEYASAAFKEHAGKVIEKAGDVIDKTGAAIDGFVDGLKSDDQPKDK